MIEAALCDGIPTLQMGVFGGIIVGLGVAALHHVFYMPFWQTAMGGTAMGDVKNGTELVRVQ